MVGMVLLVAVFLTLIGLLGVVMVAATRHLLAHPDEPVHNHGERAWSALPESAGAAPERRAVARPAAAAGAAVPLDDMPAEVLAEVARRVRLGE